MDNLEKVMLLADPNSKAWDFTSKIKDHIEKTKETEIQLEGVSFGHFRNGELNVEVPENLRRREIYFVQDSTQNPQEWWVELLLLKDLLFNSSATSVTYVLPNMLFSRKDRKDQPHVPISARALARSISPDLARIITMDLHAAQIQGFYPANVPLDNLPGAPQAVQYIKEHPFNGLEDTVVLSPDAGGARRAESFARRLGSHYPIALIDKRRVDAGKVEEMRLVGDVDGRNVLIVDDLIDSGTTLLKAAEELRAHGARELYCYGTHGIFTKGTAELKAAFDRVITSNTHYQERDGIEVVDVSPVFAEAIYRAQKGLSISKLFE
ncbi:MAG: ribose-phosphate pyrophosphokinase [Candidatus Pacearchaeota archaeon]|nr:ribose-phosphate pyrophosphokinase [Candidatus Pacearchaeota archaeon]